MSFFSEERASELRELFFESAQELLLALNEAGLELEKHPADAEIIRTIRRTVHTLKGDSAACGFRKFSELAHQFEDLLAPEAAARQDDLVAQVALSAADVFDAMLAAYRDKLQPPDSAPIRELIRRAQALLRPAEPGAARAGEAPETAVAEAIPSAPAIPPAIRSGFTPKFLWSEYEELAVRHAAGDSPLFNVGIAIDPQCSFLAAGVQLVRNVLQEAGRVLIVVPEEGAAVDKIEAIEAVLASDRDEQWIARKCFVPAVVSEVVVKPFTSQCAVPTPEAADAEAAALPDSEDSPHAEGAHVSEGIPALAPAASENILRVDAERIDTVLNLVGELIIAKSTLQQAISEFGRRFPKDPLRGKFADTLARQAQVLNELQRSVMKIRMVPVEQLFRRFPRIVRDIAKLTGKNVVLEVSGQETDLDKSILDALAEPLMHLVRNAVDHGIEAPEERVAAGKPAQGAVRLNAFHQGNQVIIEVSDNGRGIARDKVAASALEKGLVTREELERMSEGEVLDLVFAPGFSTAPEITELSGRGVGLDVVRTVLERMKGAVSIHTRPGAGTTFQIKVPLTLAIIKALLFRAGERLYAIPLGTVLEIARAGEADIHSVENREVLRLRGQVLPLVRLSRFSESGSAARQSKKIFCIVVAVAEHKFGLVVDSLIGEQELVIKALDHQLVSSAMVSGASILGDGTVVLILNVAAAVEKLSRVRNVSGDTGSEPALPELAPGAGTPEQMGSGANSW